MSKSKTTLLTGFGQLFLIRRPPCSAVRVMSTFQSSEIFRNDSSKKCLHKSTTETTPITSKTKPPMSPQQKKKQRNKQPNKDRQKQTIKQTKTNNKPNQTKPSSNHPNSYAPIGTPLDVASRIAHPLPSAPALSSGPVNGRIGN